MERRNYRNMKDKLMQYKYFRDNFEFQKEQAYSKQAFTFAQKQQTMENKKIYCGSGKKRSENWITATINLAKFKDHVQEYKGHKFLKLNINILDEADKFGKDVQITINQFKGKPEQMAGDGGNEFKPTNDLPF
jgi:hypothetical protein